MLPAACSGRFAAASLLHSTRALQLRLWAVMVASAMKPPSGISALMCTCMVLSMMTTSGGHAADHELVVIEDQGPVGDELKWPCMSLVAVPRIRTCPPVHSCRQPSGGGHLHPSPFSPRKRRKWRFGAIRASPHPASSPALIATTYNHAIRIPVESRGNLLKYLHDSNILNFQLVPAESVGCPSICARSQGCNSRVLPFSVPGSYRIDTPSMPPKGMRTTSFPW